MLEQLDYQSAVVLLHFSYKMRLIGLITWLSLLAISLASLPARIEGQADEEKFEFQAEVSRLMDSEF